MKVKCRDLLPASQRAPELQDEFEADSVCKAEAQVLIGTDLAGAVCPVMEQKAVVTEAEADHRGLGNLKFQA